MSGSGVVHQEYYPYGATRSGSVSTDKKFTGHQQEGDLYFMQSRFYDPEIGRFLQPDTIVPDAMNPQSLNRYSYVLNNPLRYTDPTGRNPYQIPCGGGGCFSLVPRDTGTGPTSTPTAPVTPAVTATPALVPLPPCAGGGDWCYEPLGCGVLAIVCSGLDYAFSPVASFCIATYPLFCGDQSPTWWQRGIASAELAAIVASVLGPKVKLPGLLPASLLDDAAGLSKLVTFSRVSEKYIDHGSEFLELGISTRSAYKQNAVRLATQVDQTDDILIGVRPRDGTTVVYERSTNTVVFRHTNGDIGSAFRPTRGEAYFWAQFR